MHEAPIAQGILEAVEREAKKNKARWVKKINLRIGKMTGVVEDPLRFYFETLTKGTILENAEFEIDWVPAKAKCGQCGLEYEMEDIVPVCPDCSSLGGEIISGKELDIIGIEIETIEEITEGASHGDSN
jgi:hydrogenase nickel incorporation protein HypA/HybF